MFCFEVQYGPPVSQAGLHRTSPELCRVLQNWARRQGPVCFEGDTKAFLKGKPEMRSKFTHPWAHLDATPEAAPRGCFFFFPWNMFSRKKRSSWAVDYLKMFAPKKQVAPMSTGTVKEQQGIGWCGLGSWKYSVWPTDEMIGDLVVCREREHANSLACKPR